MENLVEYRYRIVMRSDKLPGWVHWMGKAFPEKHRAELALESVRREDAFFRWGYEYKLQRQPITTEWEDMNDDVPDREA